MNILSNLKYITLCFTLSAGSLFGAAESLTRYYSDKNIAQLNAQGIRKHAPLVIFIDQKNQENPQNDHIALTVNFARMLNENFTPILVSRSIAYNYFYRRFKSPDDKLKNFIPNYKTIPLNPWSLYEVPHSQFLLFVPNRYIKYYQPNLGLKLDGLENITDTLKTEAIVNLLSPDNHQRFSVDNLRTVLNTIKPSSSEPLTKSELKQQMQSPIWDIVLHGHGEHDGDIGGISINDIQALLNFFNNELPVGTFFIESCSAGGENLTLMEFDRSINKEQVLRNLDYILIVGAITDAPTYVHSQNQKKFVKFYNNAAQLQGRGASLNTLLNNLTPLYRSDESPHGANDIPQIWLPGGLGFQTYQIDDKIQILNNVKVRKHEEERRPIKLPDNTVAALIYTKSIGVPISVTPYSTESIFNSFIPDSIIPAYSKNTPSFAEYLINRRENLTTNNPIAYPALTRLYNITMGHDIKLFALKAQSLLYPQFISMIRGTHTEQHLAKIVVEEPNEKVENLKEFTGVLHFLRDAFFDIGKRTTEKRFMIDELTGNNDISLLLESIRKNKDYPYPSEFELELRSSIGKSITLKAVTVATSAEYVFLDFMFNDKQWGLFFKPRESANTIFDIRTDWQFAKDDYPESYVDRYKLSIESIRQDLPDQKSISEVIRPSFHTLNYALESDMYQPASNNPMVALRNDGLRSKLAGQDG